jgi:hypothetical protein
MIAWRRARIRALIGVAGTVLGTDQPANPLAARARMPDALMQLLIGGIIFRASCWTDTSEVATTGIR